MANLSDIVLAVEPNGLRSALRMVRAYTAGSMDVSVLAGITQGLCRAHIMTALSGQCHLPSTSGFDALRDTFYAVLNVTGSYDAERERDFRGKALGILAAPESPPPVQTRSALLDDPVFRRQYEIYQHQPYD